MVGEIMKTSTGHGTGTLISVNGQGNGPGATGGGDQAWQDRLRALARNLWWTWHPEVSGFFRDLDPVRWRQLDHNPIALLAELPPERLQHRASELVLSS